LAVEKYGPEGMRPVPQGYFDFEIPNARSRYATVVEAAVGLLKTPYRPTRA
jgi:hypothetical protein